MIPETLLAPVQFVLDRGVAESTSAAALCARLEGKSLLMRPAAEGLVTHFVVSDSRLLLKSGVPDRVDAEISGSLLGMMRLAADDAQDAIRQGLAKISGDADVAERLAHHSSDSIRSTGMGHSALPESTLRSGLTDPHEGVRVAALNSALKRKIRVEMSDLVPFLEAGHHTVDILVWAAEHESSQLKQLTQHIKPRDMKALGDHLRTAVSHHDEPLIQHLLDAGLLEPVARWVIRQDASEDDLRWQLINDERLHVIERCKLLERLIGRANEASVMERVEHLANITDEELLKVACENLSTAAIELGA